MTPSKEAHALECAKCEEPLRAKSITGLCGFCEEERLIARDADMLPTIGSTWRCTLSGRVYHVTGHRPPRQASNGNWYGPTVKCRRLGRNVILPARSFKPESHLQQIGRD